MKDPMTEYHDGCKLLSFWLQEKYPTAQQPARTAKTAELVAYCHFIAAYCPLSAREGIWHGHPDYSENSEASYLHYLYL